MTATATIGCSLIAKMIEVQVSTIALETRRDPQVDDLVREVLVEARQRLGVIHDRIREGLL